MLRPNKTKRFGVVWMIAGMWTCAALIIVAQGLLA
jgi:hypothetical protein